MQRMCCGRSGGKKKSAPEQSMLVLEDGRVENILRRRRGLHSFRYTVEATSRATQATSGTHYHTFATIVHHMAIDRPPRMTRVRRAVVAKLVKRSH